MVNILSSCISDWIKKFGTITTKQLRNKFWGKNVDFNDRNWREFIQNINKNTSLLKESNDIHKSITNILLNNKQCFYDIETNLYNTNFSKRLDYIIWKLNQSKFHNSPINIEYLSEFFGFKSANDLLVYYKYDIEPSFQFCEEIAEKLGVNPGWMKHGEFHQPAFTSQLLRTYNAEDLLEFYNPTVNRFHFVTKKNKDTRDLLVILQQNELKYTYFPCEIVFNSKVGSTGAICLLYLYNFLKTININGNDITNIHVVPDEIFDNILSGNEFCGIVEKYSAQNNTTNEMYILYDFVSTITSRLKYEKCKQYDSNFIEMCQIVISQIDNKL